MDTYMVLGIIVSEDDLKMTGECTQAITNTVPFCERYLIATGLAICRGAKTNPCDTEGQLGYEGRWHTFQKCNYEPTLFLDYHRF